MGARDEALLGVLPITVFELCITTEASGADYDVIQVGRESRVIGYLNESIKTVVFNHELALGEEFDGKRFKQSLFDLFASSTQGA